MGKRSTPEVDSGSMADIAFLLLIFFLVTTTMEQDNGITRKLPKWEEIKPVDPPIIKKKNIFTVVVNKNDQMLVEDEFFRPHDTAVISVPQKAPEGSILRDESPFDLLERIKKVATEWVQPGHRKGSNTHNVSATVSLKQNEWDYAGEWMWENRDYYNGLSVLPYDEVMSHT